MASYEAGIMVDCADLLTNIKQTSFKVALDSAFKWYKVMVCD